MYEQPLTFDTAGTVWVPVILPDPLDKYQASTVSPTTHSFAFIYSMQPDISVQSSTRSSYTHFSHISLRGRNRNIQILGDEFCSHPNPVQNMLHWFTLPTRPFLHLCSQPCPYLPHADWFMHFSLHTILLYIPHNHKENFKPDQHEPKTNLNHIDQLFCVLYSIVAVPFGRESVLM